MDTNATLPSVGQTWLAELGPFNAEITFESESKVSFALTTGDHKGKTETMDYTATKVRDGLYVVRWVEPVSGDVVTHVQDYTAGTSLASSIVSGEFVQLTGKWTRIR
ncbi:MoaF N-terminal domain-containing protein [Streptomyces sp. NPDC046909]|uniref:MoaF-related domain-containing protein n=1 Tax=Streptomyces sp. NPDC046909 TaxID=3155617 RepID=UPI0034005E7D